MDPRKPNLEKLLSALFGQAEYVTSFEDLVSTDLFFVYDNSEDKLKAVSLATLASDHKHDSDYVSIVGSPTTGNLAALTAGGEISDSGSKPADFAASNHKHDSDYVSIVSTPTTGNLAALTAGGEISDSGSKPADFSASNHNHSGTYVAIAPCANIPDPTGGTTTDAEARSAINAILDYLQASGQMVAPT